MDANTVGSYTVTYNVLDAAGNAALQVIRTVNVVATPPVDTTPPVITLTGSTPVNVVQGSVYTDAGATASDNVDGDITSSIATVNPVDANTVGSYTVTYNVSDAAGNAALQVTRTVNVVTSSQDNTPPVANAGPDQHVVGGNTEVTLDASTSSDVDGDNLSYSWILTVPTGSSATLSAANIVHPIFILDVNGTYIAQLRVNDGTADSVLDTVAVTYRSEAEGLTGGINFSFDDNYIDSWYAARDLLNQYGAKVTFFICYFEIYTEAQLEKFRILKSDGHEIASHSHNHKDINGVLTDGGYGPASEVGRYIREEIDPSIELMSAAGLPPVTFAVPFNGENPPYIDALLEKFSFVRGGAWIGDSNITTVQSGYYTCQDHEAHRTHIHGFSAGEPIESLMEAMDHAVLTNSVVVMYSHQMGDLGNGYPYITLEKLEAILRAAQERGLKFYTTIDLGRHCL